MREWGNWKAGGVSSDIVRYTLRAVIGLVALLLLIAGYVLYQVLH